MAEPVTDALKEAPSATWFVGRRIAGVRALRGMTQQQLADKSGASLSAVQRSEQGRYSADTLVKISRVLKASLDYILEGKGAP